MKYIKELNSVVDKIEILSDYAHSSWSGWMKYLFEHSIMNNDGTCTIPKKEVERWTRQMNTNYSELSEKEKKSDREEAKKILTIFNS